MLSHQIQDWLQAGAPFRPGLALYRQTGGSFPLHYFEAYATAPWVPEQISRRLEQALTAYLQAHPIPQDASLPKPEVAPIPITPATEEPEAILELRAKARRLHKQHEATKARLVLMAEQADKYSDDERYALALEIMEELIPALDDIYDQIRHWQRTGKLPAAPVPDLVRETVRKMQRLSSLQSRCSKLRGLLKKSLDDRDRQRYEKELLEKRVEVEALRGKLGC